MEERHVSKERTELWKKYRRKCLDTIEIITAIQKLAAKDDKYLLKGNGEFDINMDMDFLENTMDAVYTIAKALAMYRFPVNGNLIFDFDEEMKETKVL